MTLNIKIILMWGRFYMLEMLGWVLSGFIILGIWLTMVTITIFCWGVDRIDGITKDGYFTHYWKKVRQKAR